MPFYFDPTYILIIIAYVITLWAQIKVKSAYAKYSKISNRAGLTGTDAAYAVLRSGGVTNVPVKAIAGELTDHYDPRDNTISLSSGVISTPSIAAVGVAAHEAGHAVQYAKGYVPIKVRSVILPVCNLGSQLSMPLLIIGLIFDFYFLVKLGVIFFCVALLFQLLTLPIEFNASHRALVTLDSSGLIREDEKKAVRKVLSAAAMTYVAALLVSLTQLIRLLALTKRNRR